MQKDNDPVRDALKVFNDGFQEWETREYAYDGPQVGSAEGQLYFFWPEDVDKIKKALQSQAAQDGCGYRRLEAGETIQEGDEIDACHDGWREEPIWKKVTNCIGEPAPDPRYPSHRQYRRIIAPTAAPVAEDVRVIDLDIIEKALTTAQIVATYPRTENALNSLYVDAGVALSSLKAIRAASQQQGEINWDDALKNHRPAQPVDKGEGAICPKCGTDCTPDELDIPCFLKKKGTPDDNR
jgi:hypothetical protein